MQVVVHIPEVYENEKELRLIFNPKNKSITYVSMNDCCYEELECIVLPKGHGRIGDLDALERDIIGGIKAANFEEGYADYVHINNVDDCVDCVKYVDAIIEADKEQ